MYDADHVSQDKRANCGTVVSPLYRAYSSSAQDHFYSASGTEAANAGGFVIEGVAAAIFATQQGDSLPLYRMYSSAAKDHFYTADPVERDFYRTNNGYVLENTAAFVYTTPVCGAVPLYRLYAASVKDHFYTTSVSERARTIALGFADEGIVAYVPGPGVTAQDSPQSACTVS
ncbi:hypothetical protein C8F01DRAFT_987642 [Mycena amicta]|nr:hypothetical protein C8F01DRAFT_987642 [Mycena amicta]